MDVKSRSFAPYLLGGFIYTDQLVLCQTKIFSRQLRSVCGDTTPFRRSPSHAPSPVSYQPPKERPPFTLMVWPVICEARDEARNTAASATSVAVGGRPFGKRATAFEKSLF